MPPFNPLAYRIAKVGVDVFLLAAAYCLAFWVRFEGSIPESMTPVFMASLPVVLLVQFLALEFLGTPKLAWRSVGITEVRVLLHGLAIGALVLSALRVIVEHGLASFEASRVLLIPFGVIFIDFLLAAFALIGIRVLWRTRQERHERDRFQMHGYRPARTVLIGTGPGCIQAARSLASRSQTGIDLVGIIAETNAKVGMMMYGLPVLGTVESLEQATETYDLEQAIIPIPDDGTLVREFVKRCEACGLRPRVLTDADGESEKLNLARVRSVTVEDLLRRPTVRLPGDSVNHFLSGRRVMVTGAGGSIGSQLCREICKFGPRRLILVEQAENNLFNIHRELLREYPQLDLIPVIADICDAPRLEAIFAQHRPQALFHAAAHKHVPMMEWNVGEAVKNNVLGTIGLADLADRFGVDHFVMVSTDKAVRPTSIMGVSKRVAEIYVQTLADRSKTCFVTVRFGNVLGSSGSVVPIFQEQIARGGPVMVTHPEMRRYFMTIPEACQLILEAGSLGQGGEIFILDMGQPVKIVDLAYDMIRLCGLVPDKDIEVRFSGVRPGEKLYEELSLDGENASSTRHPRIFIGRKSDYDLDLVRKHVSELADALDHGGEPAVRAKFKEIVPEYFTPSLTVDQTTPLSLPTLPALAVSTS
ncbi:MAG: polysaccharide biosynthesis protein [Gemmataceae bacterium]|nr:polysaccharide biosynthesis protein [Gemmataceae bacterium]